MDQISPIIWLVLVGGGVIVLGLVMAYGMARNRTRSAAEKKLTDDGTRAVYRAEDRNGS